MSIGASTGPEGFLLARCLCPRAEPGWSTASLAKKRSGFGSRIPVLLLCTCVALGAAAGPVRFLALLAAACGAWGLAALVLARPRSQILRPRQTIRPAGKSVGTAAHIHQEGGPFNGLGGLVGPLPWVRESQGILAVHRRAGNGLWVLRRCDALRCGRLGLRGSPHFALVFHVNVDLGYVRLLGALVLGLARLLRCDCKADRALNHSPLRGRRPRCWCVGCSLSFRFARGGAPPPPPSDSASRRAAHYFCTSR